MRRAEALDILKSHKRQLAALGVESARLFGSTARDQAGPGSDVDVLVKIDRASRVFSLLNLIEIQQYLEDIMGVHVDVGEAETLRPEVRQEVLREALDVE